MTTTPESICDDWPRAKEIVTVEGSGDDATLRAGLLELAITAGASECSFIAKGCAATPPTAEGGNDGRYFAPELVLSKSGAGARLVAKAVDVAGSYAGPCAEATFEMTAKQEKGCDPVGEYQAMKEASIVKGACDLTWGPGTVTVSASEDGYAVDWAGTMIDDLTLDQASCTLTGAKGVPPDFWSYNSAARTAEIELSFTEGSIKGTVKDSLDGPTFDGMTCSGATFDLAASVPPPRPTRPLDAACSEPPPPICGDGVCEGSEGCGWCDDCACSAGQECAADSACHTRCTLPTEASDCEGGERCSQIPNANEPTLYLSGDFYCEAAGPGKPSDPCAKTNDCGAGLICHINPYDTAGSCRPPCGDGFPACEGVDVCQYQGDGTGKGFSSSAVKGCEHRAALGEDCTDTDCEDGVTCLKSCSNNVCDTYCTTSCSSSADCPSGIPVCKTGYCSKD